MSHKRKPNGSSPTYKMDVMQKEKRKFTDNIKALKDAIDTEYAAEQTHLSNIYQEKKLLGDLRMMLVELDKSSLDYVFRLYNGNYILPLSKKICETTMKEEQTQFLDRIHVQEIQMRKSVQKQRELRKRLNAVMVEFNGLDVDNNYRM